MLNVKHKQMNEERQVVMIGSKRIVVSVRRIKMKNRKKCEMVGRMRNVVK